MPVRVQLSRLRGWRMPDNTLKVDRTTAFGNPFAANSTRGETASAMVLLFRRWLKGDALCVWAYPDLEPRRLTLLRRLPELRDKNLACWCKAEAPCHADVLLQMANDLPRNDV